MDHSVYKMTSKLGTNIDYQEALNTEQYTAVTTDSFTSLVIAGAGSGKTRVLTYRLAYLIDQGAHPQNVMLVTFTKKAAEEMKDRVIALTGYQKEALLAGTFHSIANRFLRLLGRRIDIDPSFTILDEHDAQKLVKKAVNEVLARFDSETRNQYPTIQEFVTIISAAANSRCSVEDIITTRINRYSEFIPTIVDIADLYVQSKKLTNSLDFDDLLVLFYKLLTTEVTASIITDQVQYLLVDEYQDVNQLQADIVIELAKTANTMVVGDDAQAIYSFRGASVKHILEFEQLLPDVQRFFLLKNYRSSPEILTFASNSISHNVKQFKKELVATAESGSKPSFVPCQEDEEEAEFVCQRIEDLELNENVKPGQIAVLFRTAAQSLILEKTLIKHKIQYVKRAGLRFNETAHVKDVIAFCELLRNSHNDLAWSRVLALHPGLGETTIDKVVTLLVRCKNPLREFVTTNLKVLCKGKHVSQVAISSLLSLQNFYVQFSYISEDQPQQMIDSTMLVPTPTLEKILDYYHPILNSRYDDADERHEELIEFINIATQYPSLKAFLEEVTVSEEFVVASSSSKVSPIVLSTIHQAKGLEWNVVFLMGVADNILPHQLSMENDDDIEEERRLFYVASTRARRLLILSYPQARWKYNHTEFLPRSRFIDELEDTGTFSITNLQYE